MKRHGDHGTPPPLVGAYSPVSGSVRPHSSHHSMSPGFDSDRLTPYSQRRESTQDVMRLSRAPLGENHCSICSLVIRFANEDFRPTKTQRHVLRFTIWPSSRVLNLQRIFLRLGTLGSKLQHSLLPLDVRYSTISRSSFSKSMGK